MRDGELHFVCRITKAIIQIPTHTQNILLPSQDNIVKWRLPSNLFLSALNTIGLLKVSKGKGRPTTGHEGPESEWIYSYTLSLTSELEGVGSQRHAPAALPPVKAQYPLYSWLGGVQILSGKVRKISPLPVFDPRTVQPVASRSTDWAIAVPRYNNIKGKGHPITGHEGPEGGRGIDLLLLDLGARRGWVVNTTPLPVYPGKHPVPLVQEAGWAPWPLSTCVKNLASTGIRSPDSPARSETLYRLRYRGSQI
jgi:hypothetical protein